MPEPEPANRIDPPLLEQLGALYSLLVHELANHLCVISGNVTFAELIFPDPERLPGILRAILQASDNASHLLERSSELRRRLADRVPRGRVSEIREALDPLREGYAGWSVRLAPGLDGAVRMPSPWVAFCIERILAEIKAPEGQITFFREDPPAPEEGSAAGEAHDPPFLVARLVYASADPLSMKDIRTRFENHGLLAAFELNRTLGGRIESASPSPGRQEVRVYVPFVDPDFRA